MYKISQRELLEEGFWSKFGAKVRQIGQVAKEVGKVVAPKTSGHIANVVAGTRAAQKRVGEAGETLEERIQLWLDEQGFFVKTPLKMVKKFAGGDRHFSTELALKDVDKETGESIEGRNFTYPRAIILYNKENNQFKWAVKPNRNQMASGRPRQRPRQPNT